MPVFHRDYETRSALNLKTVGHWAYAAAASTEVLCAAFAVDDGPIRTWLPGIDPVPPEYAQAAVDPNWIVVAHHDAFETAIEERILAPRFGLPVVPYDRHECTVALAYALALPGSLEGAAAALHLPEQKDLEGEALMLKIARRECEPTAEDIKRLSQYCVQDVVVERALYRCLPPLLDSEQRLWVVDKRINARGFPVDRELALAVQDLAPKEQQAINDEIARLTDGAVTKATQSKKLKEYLNGRGHKVQGVNKRSVGAVLAHGPADDVRRILELRREGARTSVRKVKTLLACLDADDRLRGTLTFHGAATGRWTGRRFQPQNLKRPETKNLDAAVDALLARDVARIRELGSLLTVAADVSRSMICAPPGRTLMGADLAAIESVVTAWLAGEMWKLDAFRRFHETGDATLEPYCILASKILGRPVTPDDEKGRALGKVADLSCTFGGGPGAWRNIDGDGERSDKEIQRGIDAWRDEHPNIVRYWKKLFGALKRAIRNPGMPQSVANGRLVAEFDAGILWVTLPSGRKLAYPEARVNPDGKFGEEIAFRDNAAGGWRLTTEWHGTFVENITQAVARDIMAAALIRLDAAGFEPVLHVHDEIVVELPEEDDRAAEFLKLITTPPDWASDMPIAAKAWRNKRYAKPAKQPAAAASSGSAEPAAEKTEPAPAVVEPAAGSDDNHVIAQARLASQSRQSSASMATLRGLNRRI